MDDNGSKVLLRPNHVQPWLARNPEGGLAKRNPPLNFLTTRRVTASASPPYASLYRKSDQRKVDLEKSINNAVVNRPTYSDPKQDIQPKIQSRVFNVRKKADRE